MEQQISYANYVKEQRGEEADPEDGAPAPVLFNAGPGDLPLLPAPLAGVRNMEIARHAKEIIRAYFLRHYRMFPNPCYLSSIDPPHLFQNLLPDPSLLGPHGPPSAKLQSDSSIRLAFLKASNCRTPAGWGSTSKLSCNTFGKGRSSLGSEHFISAMCCEITYWNPQVTLSPPNPPWTQI